MVISQVKAPAPRLTAEHRREQILETATQLFARQGFQGTTTREIAQHAQVNEAILFRHFVSKEDLYWAVIQHQCERGRGSEVVAEYVNSDLPAEQVFVDIAQAFLGSRQKDFILGRLLLFSALEQHELSRRFFQIHIAEIFEVLAAYIQRQIEAGKFRKTDPMLAARGFWGMVVYHFLVQELFGAKQDQPISNEEASRTLVDIWLGGMLKPEAQTGVSQAGLARTPVKKQICVRPSLSAVQASPFGMPALRATRPSSSAKHDATKKTEKHSR